MGETIVYAATRDGDEILSITVASSETGAIRHWLMIYGDFTVPKGMGDFAVRDKFVELAKPRNVKIERFYLHYAD